jgi:hypothetical protein
VTYHYQPDKPLTEEEKLLAAVIGLSHKIPCGGQICLGLNLDNAIELVDKLFLPACAQVPTHIKITPAGKLRFTTVDTRNPTGFAEFTASPPTKAGSWPAIYTADSARTAAAQLLAYAHAYRTHVEGQGTASAHAEVRLVGPDSRTARASRWDLGMSGINIRYVAPFTAFLDIPAPNQLRTLTHIAAEEWAGALLALARELDRARVVAEHAIWADRNNLDDTAWLRMWLDSMAPELGAEQTELAYRLRGELDDLDRHRTAQRAHFAAGRPATRRTARA